MSLQFTKRSVKREGMKLYQFPDRDKAVFFALIVTGLTLAICLGIIP